MPHHGAQTGGQVAARSRRLYAELRRADGCAGCIAAKYLPGTAVGVLRVA